MHRPLQKILIAAFTATMVFFGLMTPVSAQDATPTDSAEVQQVDTTDEVQHLRLRCRGRINRSHQPVVRCKWTRPAVDTAAYTVVERIGGDSDTWTPIFRSENVNRRRYVDKSIVAGVRYRYRVRVYDSSEQLVAASRSNGAGVHKPGVEIVKIACKGAVDDTGDKTAGCEWSSAENASSYQLWRIVNRKHRDLVGTYGADVLAVQDIDVPDDAKVIRYAVLALDADDEIIGRSRVAKVRFPSASESDQ